VAPALCVSKGMGVGEGLCWLTKGGPLSPLVHGGVIVVLGVVCAIVMLGRHCVVFVQLSVIVWCLSGGDEQRHQ